ncbi:dihydroorotate dehydrogenase electron transfer subunit [Allobaculum mucilyticum]|uniref:dihydroorotate dehydrogenase electron transfer subunit n=1 Tax=Allobaculum mucilyticum TaxID=2834459 RepID=UPI001E381568|nr:dihydroorotate dehydrogenase electron transfer subunit [Allobaculum mucilyticum]UNT95130.1 dihydroorotate dehydrogenase electron transfer subunit [Allobaculum mucilyticum]
MKQSNAVILSNAPIARDVFKMDLRTDLAPMAKPGQFVQVAVPGFFLRRPISVSWTEGDVLRIVYKIMGNGTDKMSSMKPGEELSLLGPLGTGFPIKDEKEVVIMGGGVGTPPMLKTAKAYLDQGSKVDVILGFNTAQDVFYVDEFEQLGISPVVCTMDGSAGVKGTVLDGAASAGIKTDYVLACGPLPMLRAISASYTKGYISLESRMGCGFGVCNGCVMTDTNGMQVRVCKNGPVFPIGKVVL